ncbi:MAG: hypothetical protein F6J95_004235 [Leptolyngbya sp. SIO1E4]|nr:hypothetical protein [Leptolyngbya sp. SIO1E4]
MGADILILTIYLICVTSVLYQMALSVEAKLEDQVEVVLDGENLQAAITAQLQQQNIYQAQADILIDKSGALLQLTFFDQDEAIGKVMLQVFPQGKLPLQPPLSDLKVSILNNFPDQQVFLNWDGSSLSVHGGLAQRVIRKVPGMPIDLFQPQAMTVANPGQMVSVAVTSESLFKRPEDKTALEPTSALINLGLVPEMKEPLRMYSLGMLMLVRSMATPNGQTMQLLLPFNFQINVLPDHVALPLLSWLLKRFSFRPKKKPQ